MADITVRKDPAPALSAPLVRARDTRPLRMLRDLFRWQPRDFGSLTTWDPFEEMAPLLNEMATTVFSPAFEVKEVKNAYLFKADVPGVKESDIEVHLTGNRLTISGSRSQEVEESSDTYYSCGCSYGDFSRSFTLPEGTDAENIHADLKSGVLTVAVPKRPEAQSKKIAVKSSSVKA